MTANTGRTTNKWVSLIIDDSTGSTLRTLPLNSLGGVGLIYDEISDMQAWSDAVHSALPGIPSAAFDASGPFDNTATTGAHIVLNSICGGITPLTLDVQFGIRHAWEANEPQFGITATSTAGYLCTSYTVDPASMNWTAHFVPYMGSTAPAWGTAAETT